MPPPQGPGVAVSVDYFGPLPVTSQSSTDMLLFIDRFSRRDDMFLVTAAEFTAEGTANIRVYQYIPLWGFPRTILSDNGLLFCSKLSQAVYQLLGVHKLATSSYHPKCNGGVERVNNTIALMLAMVVNERQDDWNLHPPHVELDYINSVSAATGLAPNESHISRLPRLPLTVSTALVSLDTRVWPVTTWLIETWPPTGKSARRTLSAHITPSPFPVLASETPPSPTRCI